MFVSMKKYKELKERYDDLKDSYDLLENLQGSTERLACLYLRKIEELEEDLKRLKESHPTT